RAVAACAAKTYAVSAVVVDRDGETIVEMRGDEAAPHTMENARRKAYTAMTFKQPTAEYAKKLQDPTSVAHQQVTLPNVIAIPGGQPIKVGDQVIGGIGVSGSPGVDDDCVNAGLAKAKDQLQKPLSSPRLLKLQHEIVDRHIALEAREVVRVGGIAPEIAGGDELETGGFDFLAQSRL